MMPPKRRRPDLDHCVQILQTLTKDLSSKPPKVVGEIYVAAVGLLYHLKIDQATLRDIRNKAEGKPSASFPKPNAIPAITAVVHNQVLFRALISCLSLIPGSPEAEMKLFPTPSSRKRTHSVSDIPESVASKSLKLSHSPQVGKRAISYTRPQMNVKILAATILYVSFEHLDHWPVPLVKAYAEDCFGPRSWVDEPACQLLVKNLALSHAPDYDMDTLDPKKESDALAVANFFQVKQTPQEVPSNSPVRQKQRGSISSLASHSSIISAPQLSRPRSMSSDSFDSMKPGEAKKPKIVSAKSKPSPANKMKADDSDSGGEEEIAVSTSVTKKSDDGDSSSSGEEDEEVVVGTKPMDDDNSALVSPNSRSTEQPPRLRPTYPYAQEFFNFDKIRQRYFGINLDYAHLAISASLNERLDVKSKHNSGLLQTLPSFTTIPAVRSLITANLEKWLQSPALAGLGRSLFSTTVNMMKNTDPPLPADLETIDNILGMKLKVNQLNAHVENVTAIASKIPTSAVANHIFSHLLRVMVLNIESPDSSASDHLKMINAVYNQLPKELAAEGIAAALLSLLIDKPAALGDISTARLMKRLLSMIRAIAKELGGSLDSCQLLDALLAHKVQYSSWGINEEENKARLMFQCVTLLASKSSAAERKALVSMTKKTDLNQGDGSVMKAALQRARKILLGWCCTKYAPLCSDSKKSEKQNGTQDAVVGAGIADYNSILDGLQNDVKVPRWLELMRCVLFLEGPESPSLHRFLFPDGVVPDADWQHEKLRISRCCEYGTDVDDEMVWMVLNAATYEDGMSPEMALKLLEHIFHGCNKNTKSTLNVQDANILGELYKLVEYIPSKPAATTEGVDGNPDQAGPAKDDEGKSKGLAVANGVKTAISTRLAFPGMWWRVTSLALIMCGASPGSIGIAAWNEYPTLRALMKMVTSDRYRFPTVDCDEASRDEMKKTEQAMRDEEAKITELLFLPKKNKKKKKENYTPEVSYGGSRASKRQQEKREKILQKQREKEKAEAQAEAHRRKKLLRAAQKSIMIWDPRKGARKPPRESADLIFAVGESFDLPKIFQRSVEPDFLLMTIGNTSRGAIERAYDWLIPIISVFPDTISRLPASASCFLLLRAYGTEGEERSQLQNLSSPLLDHVRMSLTGQFGEADAIRAFDLLLTDVASHNSDRRRCARRVLHDAIGKDESDGSDEVFSRSNCLWMVNILNVEHCVSVLGDCIEFMTQAASFERGRTLRYIVLALERLTKAAVDKKVPGKWDFPAVLVKLISSRPTVFAATMGAFPDLRVLAISLVHNEFKSHMEKYDGNEMDSGLEVEISLCTSDTAHKTVRAILPLSLLQCACVLLSIWLEGDDERGEAVHELVGMLMKPQGADPDGPSARNNKPDGLASARFVVSGKSAIPVESWVMLARSRSDFIAKRAALTAPTGFLPRLLLCSGLPRASLLTMIDRLGKLGDKAPDQNKVFNQLLVPSAASEWDIGRLGHRREVSRKLLGRLSAYARMYQLAEQSSEETVSFTFLDWLAASCKGAEKPRKIKSKKTKTAPSVHLSSLEGAGSILASCTVDPISNSKGPAELLQEDTSDMTSFLASSYIHDDSSFDLLKTREDMEQYVEWAFETNKINQLQTVLEEYIEKTPALGKRQRKDLNVAEEETTPDAIAFFLLKSFNELERKTEEFGSCILKWVPRLSASSGSPDLWNVLFSEGRKPGFMWENLISRCVQSWSPSHLSNCRDWLLAHEGDGEVLGLRNVVFFLIHSSSLTSVHRKATVDTPVIGVENGWMKSEQQIGRASRLALDCLKSVDGDDLKNTVCGRNSLPDSVTLLLLIAQCGKKQLQWLCQVIMESLEKSDESFRPMLLSIILRLYAYCPQSMNLGVAVLRAALIEAVEKHATIWLEWRSPLDDQFKDMIDAVIFNGAPPRLVQALADGSKKHPLLLLRKLEYMGHALEADATLSGMVAPHENRGIVSGQNLSGPLPAKVDGKLVKVNVIHWGFSFTENVWISFLDIVSTVPKEVLFGCGLKMGLLDLLAVYLRLMFVQSQLRTSERGSKLKSKLSEFFEVLKASNKEGWETWLGSSISGLPSLGATRNVLMSCEFISHQQAIDSVKRSNETNTNGLQAK